MANRRAFLAATATGAGAIFALPISIAASSPHHPRYRGKDLISSGISDEFPSQERSVVQEVVGAAHGQFDRLKELVDERPELAKATYDWGFGDWESALGAASHMGRKDIAEYLMAHGARPNLFTHCMLGHLNVVNNILETTPQLARMLGPHSFTLMRHAKIRLAQKSLTDEEKKVAQAMVDYQATVDGTDEGQTSLPVGAEEQQVYMGKYLFGKEANEYFDVSLNSRDMLYMSRGEDIGRTLMRVEGHTFAPTGAPSVRIRFDVAGDRASAVTVHDPGPLVTATRAE